MMAGIQGTNTQPELLVRRALHARGFRFRIHDRRLPGKPDVVLPRYAAVVRVHGCFWHLHECRLFKWPMTRHEFWAQKLLRNRAVDEQNQFMLHSLGWRVATVWECALRMNGEAALSRLIEWLTSDADELVVPKEADSGPV